DAAWACQLSGWSIVKKPPGCWKRAMVLDGAGTSADAPAVVGGVEGAVAVRVAAWAGAAGSRPNAVWAAARPPTSPPLATGRVRASARMRVSRSADDGWSL